MKIKLYYLAIFILIASCGNQNKNSDDMDFQAGLEEAHDQLINKGNVDYADSIFAPDYNKVGPEGIKNFVTELRTAFPDLQVSVETKVQNGNLAAWTRTHTGTQMAPIMGFLPINNEISWQSTIITEMNGQDMVAAEWGNNNLANQLEKLSANGAYEYLPPLKGHAIINMDKFIWSITNTETNVKLSEYGHIEFMDGIQYLTIEESNIPEREDSTFKIRMLGQVGDTVKWNYLDKDNKITGLGQALKVSQ